MDTKNLKISLSLFIAVCLIIAGCGSDNKNKDGHGHEASDAHNHDEMTLRKISLLLLNILLITAWLFGIDVHAQNKHELSIEGQQAPEFSLSDLNGNQVS